MATIRRVPAARSGRCWEAQIRLRGHAARSRRFTSRNDAVRWAAAEERLIRLGLAASSVLLFRDLVEAFRRSPAWTERRASKSKDEPKIDYWLDAFAAVPVSEITTAAVARHRDQLSLRFAGSTVNGYLAQLSAIFKAAGEYHDGVANPVRLRRRKSDAFRIRYLSDAEFHRLVDAAAAEGHPTLLPMILAALSSGARQGELLSLRWQDVDLERGTAVLRHDRAKTGHLRTLRFRGPALEGLRHLSKHGPLLWSAPGCGDLWPRYAWYRVLGSAEIEDFRWHDLRHTSATWLAMQGAGGPEIQLHLGHRSLAITDRYVHLAAGQRSDVGPTLVPRYL